MSLTDGAVAHVVPASEEVYDDALVEAVKRFQARQGLDVDGVVGSTTIVAMNVPVVDRIKSIIVAMERLRWMPEDLGQQYLIVNIAGFELRRVRAGKVEERMAVVVGKPYHRTPVFSGQIRYLEFNPYWNVPPQLHSTRNCPSFEAIRAPWPRRAMRLFRAIACLACKRSTGIGTDRGIFRFSYARGPATTMRLGASSLCSQTRTMFICTIALHAICLDKGNVRSATAASVWRGRSNLPTRSFKRVAFKAGTAKGLQAPLLRPKRPWSIYVILSQFTLRT